jgi:hypothetical protein
LEESKPVAQCKTYEESKLPLDMKGDVQTLNLSGKRPFSHIGWSPLDERERTQRDHAHYEAYRILRLTLGVAVIAYWISLNWTFTWLSTRGPILAWILLLYNSVAAAVRTAMDGTGCCPREAVATFTGENT